MFSIYYKNQEWTKDSILSADHGDDYILNFCKNWFNGHEVFSFQTSGSTGAPKLIELSRKLLEASAKNSINALGLKEVKSALLCMNPRFVGSTQMMVRAILGGYKLYITEASSYPISGIPPVDFISLVPLQLKRILSKEEGQHFLNNCKVILVGGAGIDPLLEESLRTIKSRIYHSYGMTETASHIAIRDVKKSDSYTTLPGISISVNDKGCLVIDWEILDQPIETSDLVDIIDQHHFSILGRADMIINSGALKISPESIEKKIARELGHIVPPDSFVISSLPDEELGNRVVLVTDYKNFDWENGIKSMKWEKYYQPREIIYINKIPQTASQKVDRRSLRQLINKK